MVELYHNHSTAFEINYRRTVVPDESLALSHLLSRELMKLSLTERTAVQEEIHGVRCLAIHETPELIETRLTDFHTELDKIPKDQKRTYEECRVRSMLYRDEEDSCYALHDEFKLRFLRVELFDAAKAVQRFVKYLEFVREYWGADVALKRQVRFSDFDKAEMKLFRKGYFQVLPFRDHSGRRIVTLLGGFDQGTDPLMRTKAIFYLMDVLTRTDVETQQRGVVVITEACCWSAENTGSDKRSKSKLSFPHPQEGCQLINRILKSIPNRLIAFHNCWPDRPAFRIISKLFTIYGVSGSTQRLRLKFHIGDELEMRYRLKSYGIPMVLLPITETGSIKMINHNFWIKTRKHVEQGIDTNVTIVECPGSNDVAFRQGTSSMENPGNVKCRDLIISLLEDREGGMSILGGDTIATIGNSNNSSTTNMTAKDHNDLVDRLVNQIEHGRCGHFLEWDKNRSTWVQLVNRAKIKQKVSVLLHSINKRYRRTAAANISSNSNSDISSNSNPVQRSGHISPSLLLQQNLDAMTIKSDGVQEEASLGGLGPYSFLEGGGRNWQQQQCCRVRSDVFPSPDISRKRLKQV